MRATKMSMQNPLNTAVGASHQVYEATIRIDIPRDARIFLEFASRTQSRRHAAVLSAALSVYSQLPDTFSDNNEPTAALLDSVRTAEGVSYLVSVFSTFDVNRSAGLTVDRRNRFSDLLASYATVESLMMRVSFDTNAIAYPCDLPTPAPENSDHNEHPYMKILPEAARQYVVSLNAGAVRNVREAPLACNNGRVVFDVSVDGQQAA